MVHVRSPGCEVVCRKLTLATLDFFFYLFLSAYPELGLSRYIDEVDNYLIDFLKIRYYLTKKTDFPNLKCIDKYFTDRFPELNGDRNTQRLIWQSILNNAVLDESKCKSIKALYHFTHKANLGSILQHGILTRANLNLLNLKYLFNDPMRLDNVMDSISLSFSHPNFKMFYKYRKLTDDNSWVVLKISPSLLYGEEDNYSKALASFNYLSNAVFCHTNAASGKIRHLSISERMTCDAFLNMFESPIGRSLPTYTYDNQAEILFLSDIPVEFIEEIYVLNHDENLSWVQELGYQVSENDVVFDQRRYRDG